MSVGLRLFVAEKPAVAKDLAAALGARKSSSRPCYEGDGVWVSWCIGHLVEVAEPHEHDPAWKRWSAEQLPMLPRQLVLRPVKRTADHFRSLAALLRDARVTEVINACDAGREGELIFRYVYGLSGCTRPIRRFWVSSLTPSAIATGLANLRPGADYEPLAAAARCRAEADWLVGMNATRGLTLRGGTLLSVGRVQTPTLAMVVDREAAIEAFVPDDYWQVQATAHPSGLGAGGARVEIQVPATKAKNGGRGEGGDAEVPARPTAFGVRWVGSVGGDAPAESEVDGPGDPEAEAEEEAARKAAVPGRLPTAEAAAALVDKLEGAAGVVSAVQRSRKHVPPPPLYDLTALQREANSRYGVSAKDTLDIAQALYEKHKLLTYPRTDSRHLSQDVARTLPDVLDALAQAPASWAADAARLGTHPARNVARDRRYVDDGQVSDHHAILPTTKVPDLAKLTGLERRIYELVARRVLAVHAPDAIWAHGRIEVEAAGERLEARGRTCLDPGWEAVDPPRRAPAAAAKSGGKGGRPEAEPEVELPPVEQGQPVVLRGAEATAHQTRPPPRYTEASILGAMERAGRDLDEAALRAAMRDGGLGTPATRAATLETLIDRAYIAREGRALVPLPAGRALIGALPVAALKSARLTGEWEARLQAMARGREDPMAFRRDIRAFVRAAVGEILAAPALAPIEAAAPSWRAAAGKKRSGRAAAGGSSERGRGRGAAKAGATRAGASHGGTVSRAAGASKKPGGRSARGSAGKAAPIRGAGSGWAGGDERRVEYDDDRNDSNGFAGFGAGAGGAGGRTWSTGLSGRRGDAGRWGGGSASVDSEVRLPPAAVTSRAAVRVPDASPPGAAETPNASTPAASARASARVASDGASSPVGLRCPVCGEGRLMAGRAAWGCARWREGCRLVVPFEFEGVVVPPEEAARLAGKARQTRLFARVEGRKARLILADGVVRWGFGA